MLKLRIFIFSLLGLMVFSGLLLGQAPTGKIIGIVTDNEGLPLPGVSVEAISAKLVGKATTITNADGSYRLFALASGRYTIKFSLTGFNAVMREDVVIRVEETITVNITMTPGRLEEEIIVTGKAPLIDTKNTTKGMNLTKEAFATLPKGRNFDSLVIVVPGVNIEPYLGGISVDGASGGEKLL